MKLRNYFLLFLVLIAPLIEAQQLPHYTQYMLNQYGLNPAAITSKSCFDAKLGYRTQWVGLEGKPITQYFSVNGMIPKVPGVVKGNHGVGLYIENDEVGVIKRTSFNLSYSYHKAIARELTMSVGFFAGLIQYGFDGSRVYMVDRNDPIMNGQSVSSIIFPDITPGIWLYNKNLYGGLAIKSILRNKLGKIYGEDARQVPHIYTTYGYRFLSMNKTVSYIPSFMLKFAPLGPPSLDLNLMIDYRNRIAFGVSYRTIDALAGLVRVNLGRVLSLGYSFDYSLSKIKVASSNSHEMVLGIRFCKQKETTYAPEICPAYR